MVEPNVISFSAGAEKKDCARSTLYRAADDGRLTTTKVGRVRMIVRDDLWDEFEPKLRGRRVQKEG